MCVPVHRISLFTSYSSTCRQVHADGDLAMQHQQQGRPLTVCRLFKIPRRHHRSSGDIASIVDMTHATAGVRCQIFTPVPAISDLTFIPPYALQGLLVIFPININSYLAVSHIPLPRHGAHTYARALTYDCDRKYSRYGRTAICCCARCCSGTWR